MTEDWYKTQYIDDFVDYYDYMNSEAIPAEFGEITRHHAKRNMEEIHSLILAHYFGIPVFMSNDSGAKQLAQSRIDSSVCHIDVKNVCEVFCDIKRISLSNWTQRQFVPFLSNGKVGWKPIRNLENLVLSCRIQRLQFCHFHDHT